MPLLRGVTRNVVILGLVSFFTDLASEMLYPIIPLFLTGTLHLNKEALGLIEGLAEGISTGLRWVGGVLSDLSQRRKPFVFWGYTISAFSKPIMGLAALFAGWPVFLAGRASDRLGKSIRTAARDALIADATAPEHRGVAFGFHRAMDTCGAILGPLIALAVLLFRPQTPLYYLFFIAFFPGLVSGLLILLAIRDKPHTPDPAQARAKTRFWQHYPAPFWQLIAANALFSLGNSSDSLLILRSTELFTGKPAGQAHPGSPEWTTITLYATGLFAAFNVVYALIATPAGKLSDLISRKYVITIGWLIYAAVYAGFALAHHTPFAVHAPWLLFGVYGLYQAFTEGVTKAYVSDLVPASQRAGAIGLYYTVAGFAQLAASFATGFIWEHLGVTPAFLLGTIFPLLAVPLILSIRRPVAAATLVETPS